MKCSHCGKRNKDNAIVCARCGAALPPSGAKPDAASAGASAARSSAVSSAEAESGSYSIEEFRKSLRRRRRRIWMWIIITVLLLAAVCYAVFFAGNRLGQYLPGSRSYSMVESGDDTCLLYGGKSALPDIDIASVDRSIDARTAGVLDDNGRLLLARAGKSSVCDADIADFAVADGGGVIVYRDSAGKLFSFNCKKKDAAPQSVCSEQVGADYAVSPEGKYVIYTKVSDGALYLCSITSGKETRLAKEGLSPVSVAEGGKLIYTYSAEECALYKLDRKGNSTYLRGGIGSEIRLNFDHGEICYASEAANGNVKTFVYVGGREYEVGSGALSPVMTVSMLPHESEKGGLTVITCPIKSFDSRLFYGDGLFRFAFAGSEQVSGSTAESALLSDDLKQLYYLSDGRLFRCSTEAPANAEKIAEDCAEFIISSNGGTAWLLAADGRLSCIRAAASAEVDEEVSSMAASPNGRELIYLKNGEAYYCRSSAPAKPRQLGLKAESVAVDSRGMYVYENGSWQGVTRRGKLYSLIDDDE